MKSEEQKKLEGTYRSDRKSDSLSDSFPELRQIQTPPEWFTERQAKHYIRISELLFESGLLKKVDQFALEQVAIAYDNFEMSTRALNEDGIVNRHDQVSPFYTMQKDAMKIMSDFSRRFGLSISDRNKLKIQSGKTEGQTDLFEQHLRKVQ